MSPADDLVQRFETSFPSQSVTPRTLGREGEHPVVHPDGTAADIAVLWPRLVDGGGELVHEGDLVVGVVDEDVTYSAEVGRGTMEIIVGPCPDLHHIRDAYERGMSQLVKACRIEGLVVLGYGIQPVTPGTPALMTPKQRYGALLDVLGPLWLHFAVTASDQTHVSVGRDEVLAVTDLLNALAPAFVALLGNSSVAGGEDLGVASGREALMGTIQSEGYRHGMPQGPAGDAATWVERSLDLAYLMHKRDGRSEPATGTFRGWLEAAARAGESPEARWAAWLHHDHYIWNTARPRTAHGTVELRCPCQQPWPDHMAPSALAAGVVSNHRAITSWLEGSVAQQVLGARAPLAALWPALRAWHHAAIREGLAAAPPTPGFFEELLALARAGLTARGLGEEVYLKPLWARVSAHRNPGQEAALAFAEGGVPKLLAARKVG
jgi:glutamate--cysteine ligase